MRLFGQCDVCHKVRHMHISAANQAIGKFTGICDLCEDEKREAEKARKEKTSRRR